MIEAIKGEEVRELWTLQSILIDAVDAIDKLVSLHYDSEPKARGQARYELQAALEAVRYAMEDYV